MFICNQSRLKSRAAVLHMCMLILSAPFPAQPVSPTSLPSWTGLLDGRKRCRWPLCPPPIAQPGSFMAGFNGLASQQPSPAIGAHSLHPPCGLHSAPSSTSPMCRPLPIIRRQTALWRDSTAASKMPCGPAQQGPTGTPIYHGLCSGSGLHGGKIHSSLQLRRCLVRSQYFRASSSILQNRHRRHSSRSCSTHSATEHHLRRTTTTAQGPSSFQRSSCSPATCWFAAMGRSRPCRRCTTDHTWFWKDLSVSSNFRWERGKIPFLLFASSRAGRRQMCSLPFPLAAAGRPQAQPPPRLQRMSHGRLHTAAVG